MNKYLRDRIMRGRDSNYDYRSMDRRRGGGDRMRSDYDESYDREYSGRDYARGERRSRGRSGGMDRSYDDYDSDERFEYNSDYHDMPLEISEKHMKKWEKELKNSDGSHGAKFSKEQIVPIAQQFGINFTKDKFTEEEFTLAVNMMYSDYCKALQDSSVSGYTRPEIYVNMAKAFLCDEDFDGKPYEKLALYYHCIVEYDE